ncbi:MAG: GTP 3',8-cyclase MoaA [Oscillospiraceae bacterium]|nr:GTP 3',8-cyclase MoaA [Oscillospiraceae bacterium]
MRDQFGREITYLRVSITDRCNLRCRYCMPEDGICKLQHQDILSYEELTEIVTAAAELGIKKVRVTGGEPLVRLGCADFCKALSRIPGIEELTVTTNGILLDRYAEDLKNAGVSRVNVSLDTLDPSKYTKITGGGDISRVLSGIRRANAVGLAPLKINAVLIGGFNDDEIPEFVELTRQYPVELRFIELMPMGPGGEFGEQAFLPGDTVLQKCPQLQPLHQDGGVARLYQLPDGIGRVGLISPLSRHFCNTCNRLRLTSEGKLKPCLHSSNEIPLRGLHGEDLKAKLLEAVYQKPKMHVALDAHHRSEAGRTMNTIGG